jgi:hypothetical protein
MKYFVQLKDDIVFAYHQSSTEVDIPGDNIIEVAQEGFNHLGKKYVNGDFVDAPLIKYAILDEENDNTVISIEKTIFSSEVRGPIIIDENVKVLWKWNGSDFVSPSVVSTLPTITVGGNQVTTSELAPARTDEQFEQARLAAEELQIAIAASIAANAVELDAFVPITEE